MIREDAPRAKGYLHDRADGSGTWDLMVRCPAGDHWHSHSGGNGGVPAYAPGDVTFRVGHCELSRPGYNILVQARPYPTRKENPGRAATRRSSHARNY